MQYASFYRSKWFLAPVPLQGRYVSFLQNKCMSYGKWLEAATQLGDAKAPQPMEENR